MASDKMETKAGKVNAEIAALWKARSTLLWVVSRDEYHVEKALRESAAAAKFVDERRPEDILIRSWDCARGFTQVRGGGKLEEVEPQKDPNAALDFIRGSTERFIYVLRDFHKWVADPYVLRNLRSLAGELKSAPPAKTRMLVVLSPSAEIPIELSNDATLIEYPIPDRPEIANLLDSVIDSLPPAFKEAAPKNGVRDAVIEAAIGLSREETTTCFVRSLVSAKKIDPVLVASEKKRIIAREKVLTWHDPDPRGLAAIGGLDQLKKWLEARQLAFGSRARAYGLPAPKGLLLVGVPGTGKSLTAKACATAFGCPLLRLDMGALRSKWVGESEANIRKALQVAEAMGKCVIWLDEIEKALGGAIGPQGDGGVGADSLGTLLSWMQERKGEAFVIATANDVSILPPELLRKGRFDEIFFVDLPTTNERKEIFKAALRQYGIANFTPSEADLEALSIATTKFTGAEISALVPEAMFRAFADNERLITVNDLIQAARPIVPLAQTADEKIAALRKWADERARPASSKEVEEVGKRTANLDLD